MHWDDWLAYPVPHVLIMSPANFSCKLQAMSVEKCENACCNPSPKHIWCNIHGTAMTKHIWPGIISVTAKELSSFPAGLQDLHGLCMFERLFTMQTPFVAILFIPQTDKNSEWVQIMLPMQWHLTNFLALNKPNHCELAHKVLVVGPEDCTGPSNSAAAPQSWEFTSEADLISPPKNEGLKNRTLGETFSSWYCSLP